MPPTAADSIDNVVGSGLDDRRRMVTVFTFVASCRCHPDELGYGEEFRQIVHAWGPGLKADQRSVGTN
jgi:hypothetical protein